MGAIILALFVFYLICGVSIIRLLVFLVERYFGNKRRLTRYSICSIVLLIWVLIPTYDVILGKREWRQLCEKEAGTKIYEPIHIGPEWWREDDTFEFIDQKTGLLRECRWNNPQPVYKCLSKDLPYIFKIKWQEPVKATFGIITKTQQSWINKDTNSVYASRTSINWHGGWLAALIPNYDYRQSCPISSENDEILFHKAVFIKTSR